MASIGSASAGVRPGEGAGRVHQDLRPAEPLHHLGDHAPEGIEIEEIAGHGQAADLLGQRLEPVEPAGDEGHPGPRCRQGAGQRRAQAGGRSGDHGHPSVEVEPGGQHAVGGHGVRLHHGPRCRKDRTEIDDRPSPRSI